MFKFVKINFKDNKILKNDGQWYLESNDEKTTLLHFQTFIRKEILNGIKELTDFTINECLSDNLHKYFYTEHFNNFFAIAVYSSYYVKAGYLRNESSSDNIKSIIKPDLLSYAYKVFENTIKTRFAINENSSLKYPLYLPINNINDNYYMSHPFGRYFFAVQSSLPILYFLEDCHEIVKTKFSEDLIYPEKICYTDKK